MHYTTTSHPRYYDISEWKPLTRKDLIIDIETEEPIKNISRDSFFEILGG